MYVQYSSAKINNRPYDYVMAIYKASQILSAEANIFISVAKVF